MTARRQTGLQIEHWRNEYSPTLDGKPLPLSSFEWSRSLAIHPSGESFRVGDGVVAKRLRLARHFALAASGTQRGLGCQYHRQR
jgi:hypothetical protein